MMKLKQYFLPFLLLFSGCGNGTQKLTTEPVSCQAALTEIADSDGFLFDGETLSRGGYQNDQLVIKVWEGTLQVKDPVRTYDKTKNDSGEVLYTLTKAGEIHDKNGNILKHDSVIDTYKASWEELLKKYMDFISESGCTSNKYLKDLTLIDKYKTDWDHRKNLLTCLGYECSIEENANFLKLADFSDLTLPISSHRNRSGKITKDVFKNGFATYNLVGFNIIMTQHFEPVSYEESLILSSNPIFVQHFVRDAYYPYSASVGPYLYFVYMDEPGNESLMSDSMSLDYTQMDYENWQQNVANSMHQFWQDEEGNIEYEMANLTDSDISLWLWNRLKEDPHFPLTENDYVSYIRIYDYEWQRMMGVREKYFEVFQL